MSTPGRTATAILCLLAVTGCGLRRDRITAPAGAAAIGGLVTRQGTSVPGELVKLYDPADVLRDSAITDAGGSYGFDPVSAGQWMVKSSSATPGDLGYVRYLFAGPTSSLVVPPLDLFAYGFDLVQPANSAILARPNLIAPIHFSWTAYGAPYRWASARVTDSLGVLVWGSAAVPSTSADWNGVGNYGAYTGVAVPPGRYLWRVKLHLRAGVHAASRQRQLVISPYRVPPPAPGMERRGGWPT